MKKIISSILALSLIFISIATPWVNVYAVGETTTTNDLIEYQQTQSEISNLAANIVAAQEEQAKLEQNIVLLEQEIQTTTEMVSNMLPFIQKKMHNNNKIDVLFSQKDNSDVIIEINSSEALVQESDEAIQLLISQVNELAIQKDAMAAQEAKLNTMKSEQEKYLAQQGAAFEADGISPEKISEVIEMIDGLIASGACTANDPIQECFTGGAFVSPVKSGYVTCDFGCYDYNNGKPHEGIDLSSSSGTGTPVYASAPGTVASVEYSSTGYGNNVLIYHTYNGQPYTTLYAHLNTINVSEGQTVSYDTVIGGMGTSGNSTGVHLHFAIGTGYYGFDYYTWSEWLNHAFNPREFIAWPPPYVRF